MEVDRLVANLLGPVQSVYSTLFHQTNTQKQLMQSQPLKRSHAASCAEQLFPGENSQDSLQSTPLDFSRKKSSSHSDCRLLFQLSKGSPTPGQIQQASSDEIPEFDQVVEVTLSTDYKEWVSKSPQSNPTSHEKWLTLPKQQRLTIDVPRSKEHKLTERDIITPCLESDHLLTRQSEGKLIELPSIPMKNGGSYKGSWLNRKPHGYGVYIFPDSSRYSGDWIHGYASGKGEFQDADGGVYRGDFQQNCMQGRGIYVYADGSSYEGTWNWDKYNGYGVEKKNGTIFKGKFVMGKKEGPGVLTFANGERYEGQFFNDLFDGQGFYCWPDGRKYNGKWRQGMMHGYGTLVYEDGRMYAGYYVKDKRQGTGSFQYADGRKYTGNWLNGLQHGSGQFQDAQGNVKKGTWREGKLFSLD